MKITKNNQAPLDSPYISGIGVDVTGYGNAAQRILHWAVTGQSYYLCAAPENSELPFKEKLSTSDCSYNFFLLNLL